LLSPNWLLVSGCLDPNPWWLGIKKSYADLWSKCTKKAAKHNH